MAFFFRDNSTVPVVAILDSEGNQIFDTVGILTVSATSSISYPQHTLENGVNMTDHRVRLQDRLTLSCMLSPEDFTEIYRRIKKAFADSVSFIIQTKVDTYANLYIESLPHQEDAKDTIPLNLDFVEQMFQTVVVDSIPASEAANPADTDTQDAGNKQPKEPKGPVLRDLFGGFL